MNKSQVFFCHSKWGYLRCYIYFEEIIPNMIMSYFFPNMGHSYSNEMKEIRNNCCDCHVPT